MFDDVGHPAFVLCVIYGIPPWAAHAAPRWKYGNQENFGSNWDQCFCLSGHPGQPMPPPESRVG